MKKATIQGKCLGIAASARRSVIVSEREQVLFDYAIKQLVIIRCIGSSYIYRSLFFFLVFCSLFAYMGYSGTPTLGIWMFCLICVIDAISTAMKMAEVGH